MRHHCRSTSVPVRVLGLALLAGACLQSQAADSADLNHAITLYGWLPGVSGETKYPADGGATVDSSAILDALEMAFMGTYELRGGAWSLLADAVYLDLGNDKRSRVGLPGGGEISADVDQRLSGWQIGLYGGYRLYQSARLDMTALAGLRYLTIDSSVTLRIDGPLPPELPGRTLSASTDVWDGVVGVRGRLALSEDWFAPYHLDVGAGDSDLTWQAIAGVGYRAGWGETILVYRHLEWDQGDDGLLQALGFSGPALAFRFTF
jgi:hypothetical protein